MATSSPGKSEEFVIRVPKIVSSKTKKISILKFNNGSDVDVTQWSNDSVQLVREDNESIYVPTDNLPKSGVGSEFGRHLREEARRKKMGFSSSKYSKDSQPWLLNLNTDTAKPVKKYRGIKEGGVAQNVDYWVFVKGSDGVLDAFPVDEWYNFMPISRYKTLDADEAEEKFLQRNKILNQFALKIKQQLDGGADNADVGTSVPSKRREDDDDDPNKVRKKKQDDTEDTISKKGKGRKKAAKKAKKSKKKGEDGEDVFASAESDDGDEEGREVDYMSDSELSKSSDDEPEETKVRQALIGVDEEDGMKKLIQSSDDEDEEENEDEEEDEASSEKKKKFDQLAKLDSLPTVGADNDEKASDSGSDSEDPDEDMKSPFFMHEVKPKIEKDSNNGSKEKNEAAASTQSPSTSGVESNAQLGKRKTNGDEATVPAKKIKSEKDSKSGDFVGISEDEVRRYLQRKPQSSKELVAKFKPKCQGMTKAEVVKCLADILKRLAPEQFERNGTMYFSMKK